MSELLKSLEALTPSLTRFREAYALDGELVRPFANAHGVRVVEGGIFDLPSPGDYNFRLPQVADLPRLLGVNRLAVLCEDRRQLAEAVDLLGLKPESGSDAVIGIAGGVAQPDTSRMDAMAEFLSNVLAINPKAKLYAGIHIGVCGGVDHYTDGSMTVLARESGPSGEKIAMKQHASNFVDKLVAKGVNPDRINSFVALVGSNGFEGIEQ